MIIIDVLGTPAPKGSSRPMLNRKTGKPFTFAGGSKVAEQKINDWNSAVRAAALEVIGDRAEPVYVRCCVVVVITFKLARPSGHWHPTKGGLKPGVPPAPLGKPDGDKLLRSTWDALTGIAFDDDSRIVDWAGRKRWAEPGREGAHITIEEWKA